MARESFVNGDPNKKQLKMSTVEYMKQLENKIETALKAARQNVAQAQQRMKTQFDKVSSVRTLDPGDKVLILRPTSNDKLTAKWIWPVTVLRRCENNNYELEIGKRKTIMHINCLRRFITPPGDQGDVNMMIVDETELDDDGDLTPIAPLITDRQVGGATDGFNVGQNLNPEQRADMLQLLTNYSDVFSDIPGKTNLMTHTITVTDDTPSYEAPYRIPEGMRDTVHDELMKMVENGIIKYDDETRWNSPLIIVKKPGNAGIRLVNNFRNLNLKTLDDKYQMTDPKELLSRVAGATFLTKIDLKSAFFQLPLEPSSQKFTGFITPWGVFSYIYMPVVLKCASATCQRLMDRVLRGAHKYAGTLLDDILVFDKDYASHLQHVKDVLERLRNAGLTANVKKCHFASNRIKVLGHIVENGLICPDDDKIKVIQNWQPPKNKKQLKSFLGYTNYFREYVHHYATISFPLTEMLARNKPDKLTWDEAQLNAFNRLKQALILRPVLRPADMTKDFKVFADSSTTGLSAILMQEDSVTGKNYVVAYASRKLVPRERKFPIVELELMAIVYALIKFHHWLYTKKVHVFSDHRPLQWLNSLTKHSSRLARWSLILQNYDLSVSYIPGEQQLADFLTRNE